MSKDKNIIDFKKLSKKDEMEQEDIFEAMLMDIVNIYIEKYSHVDPLLFVTALNTQSTNFILTIAPELAPLLYGAAIKSLENPEKDD